MTLNHIELKNLAFTWNSIVVFIQKHVISNKVAAKNNDFSLKDF